MTAIRVAFVCLTLLAVVGLSVGVADSSYSISPEQTIDINSQTVEFESENYTVSEIGYASVNGDLSVTTTGPDDGTYDLYLYNSERQIVTTETRLSGTATTTFDLGSLGAEAGTYILVINNDGEREVVMPVVTNGYEITIDAPATAAVDEDVSVSLEVSKKADVDESIQSVKLHVRVDGKSRQVTATETADGTYEATLEINQAGTFSVYAGIQGTDKVNGEYEVIAVSDAHTIEASEQTATETSSNAGGGENNGTDSSGGEQSTATTTSTTQSTPTATSTSQSTATDPSTSTQTETLAETKTATDTQTGTAATTDTTATDSETETTDGVVTPASSETPATTTTTGDTGLALSLSVLLALLAGWAGLNRE